MTGHESPLVKQLRELAERWAEFDRFMLAREMGEIIAEVKRLENRATHAEETAIMQYYEIAQLKAGWHKESAGTSSDPVFPNRERSRDTSSKK